MRTQAATHAGAKVPLRSPRAIYREDFADARRERLFLSSVAFFLTFAIVRGITYAIHAGRGGSYPAAVISRKPSGCQQPGVPVRSPAGTELRRAIAAYGP